MFCPKCGSEAKSNQPFCSQCGAALNENLSPSQNTSQIPAVNPQKNKKPLLLGIAFILLLVIGISVTIHSCSNNPSKLIIGKWNVYEVSSKGITSKKPIEIIEFTKDGFAFISDSPEDKLTYKIDKSDKKNLKLIVSENKKEIGKLNIKFINKNKLELSDSYGKDKESSILERIKK